MEGGWWRVTRNEKPATRHSDQVLDRGVGWTQVFPMGRKPACGRRESFTLVEILVVVSIIGLLAGLSIPAVGGALNAAKKAKMAVMAQQIRTAVVQFNTEYGYFPTNGLTNGVGSTGADFALVLTGSSNALADNPRRIAFLEVPADFTLDGGGDLNKRGIVTPRGFYKTGQSNFSISVDHDYDGKVATNSGGSQNLNSSVAVWFTDPKVSTKVIGTWK